ncbi:MAG: Ig-like domain-containing protein, partial [Planctomycetota bacterium]
TNRVEIGRINGPGNELVVGAAFVGDIFFTFSETGRVATINPADLNTNPDPNDVATLATLSAGSVVPLDANETIVSVTPAPLGLPGMEDVVMIITSAGKLIAYDPLQLSVVEVLDRGNTSLDNVAANPRSLTFSLSRENLWHVTNQRSGDAGHGGGNSLYFGNANGTPNAGTFFTGGSAHGQVESGAIDLSEYSPDDVPMLYFSYFLETDGFEGLLNDPNAFARDSFRVFVSSEQNRSWTTVATNNGAQAGIFNDPGVPFSDPRTFDEFDVAINGYREPDGRGYIARELHDNTGGWLQARIPLAPWAGHDDVRIRFEFNSAGESEQRVTEIRAVSPAVILDAAAADRQFTIEHELSGDTETFEFDLGLVLQAPAGSSITAGDQITVNGNTWTFVEGAAGANEISFAATMTATEVATEIQAALGGVGIATITDPTHASRFQVAGFGLTSNNATLENFMILETPGTAPGTNAIPVLINSPVATIQESMRVAIAEAFNEGTAPADLRPYQIFRDSVRMYGFTVTDGGLLSVFQNDANAGRTAGIYEEGNEFQLPTAEQRELRRGDRARTNGGSGLFIDDVIVGFAERGETVTGANPGIGLVANPNHEPSTGVMGEVIDQIDSGSFQLNIRLSADYEQATVQGVPTPLNRNYDTNDVIGQSVALQFGSEMAPLSGADIIDGTTVSISDSRRVLLFEFENVDVAASGVTPGNVAVPYTSDMTAGELVASLRDAINQPFVQINNEFRVFATSTDGTVSSETGTRLHLQGPAASDLFGGTDFVPALPQVQVVLYGTEFIGTNFDNMMPVAFGFDGGDSDLAREQGQILLRNNFIFDTQGFGIDVDAGPRRSDLPSPGSPQAFTSANPDDLAPGVVIFNNVIATEVGLGGIRIGGDLGTDSDAPNQYARVLNNTIVGGQEGIRILEDASPTLMNNAIALTNVAINATGAGIVEAFATLYLSNTTNVLPAALGLGAFPVQPGIGDPVFVDLANRDFYPESFSLLIDNSVGAVDDRIVLQGLRNQLGIAVSPIIAPSRDITDQLRTGAPNNNGGGTGNNVFIDIGAIDRSDTVGPIASLNVPLDNGINDSDAAESFVRVIRGTVEGFELQILDRNGVGLDDSTVTPESINVSQDGRLLVEGVDYQFSYAATNNTILIRPRTGIWDPNSAFEITLNNRDRTVFRAPNGLQVADEQRFTINDNDGNEVTFEYDSGFVLELTSSLALEITATPDSILDRDTFQLTSSDGTTTVTFEFEKIGGTDPANVAVDLTTAVTANDVRRAIFNALSTPAVRVALGISPRLEPTAQIHLGSQPGLTAAGLPTDVLLTGGVDPIQDGDTILYRSDDTVVQFEFDNDGTLQDPNSMRRISFGPRDTADELADRIAEAFALTPSIEVGGARALEGGRVYIGGDGNDDLSVNSVALTVRGRAGVSGKLELTIPATATGASIDGERFEITSDGVNQGFLLTIDSSVVTGDNIVLLDPTADADEIANVLANAIRTAFGGALDPTNVLNVVRLGEPDQIASGRPPIQTTVNVLASSITVSGFGGGTVPINFIPTIQFTEESMAGQIVAAVVDSGLNVSAFTPGGGLIYLDNVNLFIGEPLTVVGAIQDKAGNDLQPNRANRETQFTILMPGVQLDFGDATPNFPTSLADNGARHTVGTPALPRLGTEIDSESDFSLPSDDLSIPLTSPVGTGGITATSIADVVVVAFDNAQDGDTFVITIDGTPRTYELVLASDTPTHGNVPILLVPDEPDSVTAERFATILIDDLLAFAPRATVIYDRGDSGFMLQSRDDEDGALIGSYTVGANTIDGIFLNVDGSPLSFLNPAAPGGAELIVNTTGGGLLDAWVDFNGDGDFTDPGEQVLASHAVLDGENRVIIHSIPDPAILSNTDATDTWLRLRLSSAGNATDDGVVIGGEVEDYEVLIARTSSPEPVDDSFEIFEDTPLVVGAAEAVGLNDQLNGVTDLMFEVENNALNGTLVLNETDGTFSYTPNPDFYGFDSFTYRISGTQTVAGLPLPVRSSTAGTVTLRVRAVNDSPVAMDHSFVTTEPTDTNTATAVTITAAQLLTGALPHEDANVLLPPWNELEQQLSVTQITVTASDGSDLNVVPIDLIPGTSNSELRLGDHTANAFLDDGNGGFVLIGTVTATVTAGLGIPGLSNQVSQVVFQPADNYNEDNPDIGSDSINAFRYTVSDDGSTTLPNGDPEDPQPAPESVIATINIQVRPQNDPPTANDDFLADVGGTPILEDTPISIPVSLVLANDFAGQSSDDDESRGVNDGPVQLVTDFSSTTTVGIGPTNSGIALQPGLSGQGFLMFSQTNVFFRFSAAPPPASFLGVAAENMIAVRFNGVEWQYSNGVIWTNFTPQVGDRLLASIDFDTDTITDLQFASGTFNGIDQGFVDSDLTFTPLFWNGIPHPTNFTVNGTGFTIVDDPAFPAAFRPFPIPTSIGGTVDFDPITDSLVYTPPADYYGFDTFEYFIQDEGVTTLIDGT